MAFTPAIANPQSCLWRVYYALDSARVMTQAQLRTEIGMSAKSVCRSLQYLTAEGYVRIAGYGPNRKGLFFARRQILYTRTDKAMRPPNIPDVDAMRSTDELAEVMADIVRLRLI